MGQRKFDSVGENDVIFIYTTGHGKTEFDAAGNFYSILIDSFFDSGGDDRRIKARDIKTLLDNIDYGRSIILSQACYSGAAIPILE